MRPRSGGFAAARWTEPGLPRVLQEWRSTPPTRWQWQLTGELDLTVGAQVYELDAFTTPAAAVSRLHGAGRRVICYVNAGAFEDFRPDAGRFPPGVIGLPNGWPGERWLDIRRWDALGLVITDRFELCHDKGFDAIEADNVDGYAQESGFPLSARDQLAFNRRFAALAHSLRLAIALRNDLDQVEALEPDFEFAVNEECFRYRECERLSPFVAAGKVVFHVEYEVVPADFYPTARARTDSYPCARILRWMLGVSHASDALLVEIIVSVRPESITERTLSTRRYY